MWYQDKAYRFEYLCICGIESTHEHVQHDKTRQVYMKNWCRPTYVLGKNHCVDCPLSNDSVCNDILSDPSSPLIVLPYSLLCLDCWSSRFSIFVTSSLYLYSNSLAFSATSVRGNDRNGKTRTIRNVPQRMNPPHHAPIHSGSPGRILTSKLNIST